MHRPQGRRRVDTAEGLTTFLCSALLLLFFAPSAGAGAPPDPAGSPPRSLGDVSVTATRASRDVLDTAGNVTIIDREDIEASGAQNVPELLRREAGLFVTNDQTNRTGYSIEPRGFGNGSGGGASVLVLVDGRRVNEAESSTPAWELIALDNVERIEIVRGPGSAVHGDNAVGGVVEITTRSGEGPPRGTFTGRLGRYRTQEGSLWVGGSAGPLALALFADHFQSDDYRDQSAFEIDDWNGRADVQLGDRASLSLRGGYTSDEREPPGPLTDAEIEDDRRQVDPDSVGSASDVRTRFIDGTIEGSPLDALHLSLQGYYNRRNDDSIAPSAIGDFSRDFETDAIGLNLKAQLDHEIAGRAIRTLAGIDLLKENRVGGDVFTSPSFPAFDSDTVRRTRRKNLGVYLQNELQLSSRVLVMAGTRHDRSDYHIVDVDNVFGGKMETNPDFEEWSPRVAIVARANETTSAYLSYARGFRFPNLSEVSGVLFGNASVKPQRSRAYELGVKHRSERLRADLVIYRMDVKDEILLDSEVLFGASKGVQTVNVDRVRHQGIEASWAADLVSWFEVHGSYTWDDTRVERDDLTNLDGKRVPVTPRHRGNLGLLARGPRGLELGLDVLMVGRRHMVNDFNHDLDKVDAYRRWDLHLGWRPTLGEHLALGFTFDLYNMMGRAYEEIGARPTFVPPAVPGSYPSPERHYVGGVSVTLKR